MPDYISLKDIVYNYIADQISRMKILPHDKINEQKICSELNISRTPVREALIQLCCEGLLENVPRKGFYIKRLSEKEAREIYLIIGVLDGLSASLACMHMEDRHIKDMEFYIGSMALAIDGGNFEMYYKTQEAFHMVYLSICGNETLVQMLIQTKKKFLKKAYTMNNGGSDIAGILRETNEEHRKILELFKERNIPALDNYIRTVHWDPSKADFETL